MSTRSLDPKISKIFDNTLYQAQVQKLGKGLGLFTCHQPPDHPSLIFFFLFYRLSSTFFCCASVLPPGVLCSSNHVYCGSVGCQNLQAAIPVLQLCPPYFWWLSCTTWPLFCCLIIHLLLRGLGLWWNLLLSAVVNKRQPLLRHSASSCLSPLLLATGASECSSLGSGVGKTVASPLYTTVFTTTAFHFPCGVLLHPPPLTVWVQTWSRWLKSCYPADFLLRIILRG